MAKKVTQKVKTTIDITEDELNELTGFVDNKVEEIKVEDIEVVETKVVETKVVETKVESIETETKVEENNVETETETIEKQPDFSLGEDEKSKQLEKYLQNSLTTVANQSIAGGTMSLDINRIKDSVIESCNQSQYTDYDRAMLFAVNVISRISSTLLM